jgi:thioredoxin reductase
MPVGAGCDVAIVGAGPYGLATAAHLRGHPGLDVRVFGEPMSFWEERMPAGMLLRSPYDASHIADPERALTLDAFGQATGSPLQPPVPLERFIEYGRWFQQRVAPEVDRRWVSRVARENGHFRLDTADGETLTAQRVVVAAGISCFARVPPEFASLPSWAVSHASAHRDLGAFRGRSVLIVGGGQSALESAALLHEHGADVEVVVRAPRIFFLRRIPWLHRLGPVSWLLFARPEVGPAGLSRLVAMPDVYRRLPREWQDRFAVRSLRPAGAAWLRSRLSGVPVNTGRAVRSVGNSGDRVRIGLDDGTERTVDHVLLATGYQVDIAKYGFLAPELLARIAHVGGSPRLSSGFETSVDGLYVLGAPAAWSFGPLMRFVAGTEFAAPVVARALIGRRRARAGSRAELATSRPRAVSQG